MHETTAVLLDQQPMWLDALERVVTKLGISPVAKLTSTAEALTVVTDERPSLFILDTETNGAVPDGLACVREAIARVPSLKVIVISASNDQEKIDTVLSTGAVAYVLKRAQPEDVAAAIRQIFSRSLYFASGPVTSRVVPVADPDDGGLTRREREILQYVAEGSTNGQVARVLWVTEQTVKFHLANIFRKLDVTNRTQASRWAHTHGLLQRQPEGDLEKEPVSAA